MDSEGASSSSGSAKERPTRTLASPSSSSSSSSAAAAKRAQSRAGALQLFEALKAARAHLGDQVRQSGCFHRQAEAARAQLRECAVRLLLEHFSFARGKEVEMVLWKAAFYGVLSEYRRRLQKGLQAKARADEGLKRCAAALRRLGAKGETTSVGDGDRDGDVVGAQEELQEQRQAQLDEQERTERQRQQTLASLKQTSAQMTAFLSTATQFYFDLIAQLRDRFRLVLDGSVAFRQTDPKSVSQSGASAFSPAEAALHPAYGAVHQCLVFIGDLIRYHRDMPASIEVPSRTGGDDDSKASQTFYTKHSEWKRAVRIYRASAAIAPDMGTPHNQLAVLCTYAGGTRDFDAVYHYFRSLMCSQPFLTEDNVAGVFDKSLGPRGLFAKIESEGVALLQLFQSTAASATSAPSALVGGQTAKTQRKHLKALIQAGQELLDDRVLLQRRFELLWVPLHGILFTEVSMEKLDKLSGASLSVFCRWVVAQHQHEISGTDSASQTVFLPVKAAVMCVFECERKRAKVTDIQEKHTRLQGLDPELGPRLARAQEFFFASLRTLLRFFGTVLNVTVVTKELKGTVGGSQFSGMQFGMFATVFLISHYLCNLQEQMSIASADNRKLAIDYTEDALITAEIASRQPLSHLSKEAGSSLDAIRLVLEPAIDPLSLPTVRVPKTGVLNPATVCSWDSLDKGTYNSWVRACLGTQQVANLFEPANVGIPDIPTEVHSLAPEEEVLSDLITSSQRHAARAHLIIGDLEVALRGFRPFESICAAYTAQNSASDSMIVAAVAACDRFRQTFSEDVVPVHDDAAQESLSRWRSLLVSGTAVDAKTNVAKSKKMPSVISSKEDAVVAVEHPSVDEHDEFDEHDKPDEHDDGEVILFNPQSRGASAASAVRAARATTDPVASLWEGEDVIGMTAPIAHDEMQRLWQNAAELHSPLFGDFSAPANLMHAHSAQQMHFPSPSEETAFFQQNGSQPWMAAHPMGSQYDQQFYSSASSYYDQGFMSHAQTGVHSFPPPSVAESGPTQSPVPFQGEPEAWQQWYMDLQAPGGV